MLGACTPDRLGRAGVSPCSLRSSPGAPAGGSILAPGDIRAPPPSPALPTAVPLPRPAPGSIACRALDLGTGTFPAGAFQMLLASKPPACLALTRTAPARGLCRARDGGGGGGGKPRRLRATTQHAAGAAQGAARLWLTRRLSGGEQTWLLWAPGCLARCSPGPGAAVGTVAPGTQRRQRAGQELPAETRGGGTKLARMLAAKFSPFPHSLSLNCSARPPCHRSGSPSVGSFPEPPPCLYPRRKVNGLELGGEEQWLEGSPGGVANPAPLSLEGSGLVHPACLPLPPRQGKPRAAGLKVRGGPRRGRSRWLGLGAGRAWTASGGRAGRGPAGGSGAARSFSGPG